MGCRQIEDKSRAYGRIWPSQSCYEVYNSVVWGKAVVGFENFSLEHVHAVRNKWKALRLSLSGARKVWPITRWRKGYKGSWMPWLKSSTKKNHLIIWRSARFVPYNRRSENYVGRNVILVFLTSVGSWCWDYGHSYDLERHSETLLTQYTKEHPSSTCSRARVTCNAWCSDTLERPLSPISLGTTRSALHSRSPQW